MGRSPELSFSFGGGTPPPPPTAARLRLAALASGVSLPNYYRAAPLAPHRAGVRGGDPALAPHRAGVRGGDPALSRPENRGRRLVVTRSLDRVKAEYLSQIYQATRRTSCRNLVSA